MQNANGGGDLTDGGLSWNEHQHACHSDQSTSSRVQSVLSDARTGVTAERAYSCVRAKYKPIPALLQFFTKDELVKLAAVCRGHMEVLTVATTDA